MRRTLGAILAVEKLYQDLFYNEQHQGVPGLHPKIVQRLGHKMGNKGNSELAPYVTAHLSPQSDALCVDRAGMSQETL